MLYDEYILGYSITKLRKIVMMNKNKLRALIFDLL